MKYGTVNDAHMQISRWNLADPEFTRDSRTTRDGVFYRIYAPGRQRYEPRKLLHVTVVNR